jgi:hypothetical protein
MFITNIQTYCNHTNKKNKMDKNLNNLTKAELISKFNQLKNEKIESKIDSKNEKIESKIESKKAKATQNTPTI